MSDPARTLSLRKKKVSMWRSNPCEFVENVLHVKTWSGMRLVIDSVWKNQRTSVRACHGISKTFNAACIAVTFLNLYQDAIVITTAPTHRQVANQLWKEIRGLYAENAKRGGVRLRGVCTTVNIKAGPESYMIGFSTDRQTSAEGFHSPHLLWVLDEAKGLPGWIYESIEGSMTGGFARVLELSTTDGADQQCAFRQHHTANRSQWKCIRFSAVDSPFVDFSQIAEYEHKHVNEELFDYGRPRAGTEWDMKRLNEIQIATLDWVRSRVDDWQGKRDDLIETKVYGQFATKGTDNVIPLDWVLSAVDAEVDTDNLSDDDVTWKFGQDVARMGDDQNVLTIKRGKRILPQNVWSKRKTMETAGIIYKTINEIAAGSVLNVDSIGVGAGVFDRLAELGQPVWGIESGKTAIDSETYYNIRAECWWNTRELFELQYEYGNVLSIPDDPELIEDLTGMKYRIHSSGKIIMESKDDYKKRLERSPDKGDSFVYCLYEAGGAGANDQIYTPDEIEDRGIMV